MDEDLWSVLSKATENELEEFVDLLKDKWSIERTNHRNVGELRIKLHDILKRQGGHDIANLFRGFTGPTWLVVAQGAAKAMGVEYLSYWDISRLEEEIFVRSFQLLLSQMTPVQLVELRANLLAQGVEQPDAVIDALKNGVPGASAAGLILALRATGFGAYKGLIMIAQALSKAVIGRGLQFATGPLLMNALKIALGPVGWVVSAAITAVSFGGPAYKSEISDLRILQRGNLLLWSLLCALVDCIGFRVSMRSSWAFKRPKLSRVEEVGIRDHRPF